MKAAAVGELLSCAHWIVVGLRDDPARPAWQVAQVLQEHGKYIYPVHPQPQSVHGRMGYASVTAAVAAIAEEHGSTAVADCVVDCFVNSTRVGAVVDEAIAAGVRGVWLQLGVIDDIAVDRAQAAGLLAVMDRCPAIEWGVSTH